MLGDSIIAQTTNNPQLRAILTRPAQTTLTKVILPAGTSGSIISYTRDGGIVIDFGLMTVVTLPADSDFVDIVWG